MGVSEKGTLPSYRIQVKGRFQSQATAHHSLLPFPKGIPGLGHSLSISVDNQVSPFHRSGMSREPARLGD